MKIKYHLLVNFTRKEYCNPYSDMGLGFFDVYTQLKSYGWDFDHDRILDISQACINSPFTDEQHRDINEFWDFSKNPTQLLQMLMRFNYLKKIIKPLFEIVGNKQRVVMNVTILMSVKTIIMSSLMKY
jgi:hypothetical protein